MGRYMHAMAADRTPRRERLGGRVPAEDGRRCEAAGCAEPGEFRAPRHAHAAPDSPRDWRWLCLDHVRAFNAAWDYLAQIPAEERWSALSGHPSWERATRAFASNAEGFRFEDSAGLMRMRFGARWARANGQAAPPTPITPADAAALSVMGLGADTTRAALRARYAELVQRFHPDRNGGDRAHEAQLRAVIDAYTRLRQSPAFAGD